MTGPTRCRKLYVLPASRSLRVAGIRERIKGLFGRKGKGKHQPGDAASAAPAGPVT